LRVGDAIIAPRPFEPGETRVFAMLIPSNKGFEDQIDANSHILQDLGMCYVQRGTLLFECRIRSLLLKTREDPSLRLIDLPALFKQMVIEPATLFKRFVE
jgi:hypothetical protein